MQVKDILPMLALLKSQRVKLYHAPDGELLGNYNRTDIQPGVCDETIGKLMDATLICVDANNQNINLHIATGRD
nr:MAG TPA: hypothetical protein [Caudoviricetes sp.]